MVIGGHRRRCSIGSYSLSPEFALLIVTGDRRVAGGAGRTDSAAPRPGYETGLMQERDGNSRPEVLVSVSAPASAETAPPRVDSVRHERVLRHVKHVGTFGLFHHQRRARAGGFDDAVFIDSVARISEGTIWSIGFSDRQDVIWPTAPALPGITMRLVPEGLARAGIASQFERSGRPSSARSGLRSLPTPARPRAAHSGHRRRPVLRRPGCDHDAYRLLCGQRVGAGVGVSLSAVDGSRSGPRCAGRPYCRPGISADHLTGSPVSTIDRHRSPSGPGSRPDGHPSNGTGMPGGARRGAGLGPPAGRYRRQPGQA